ncbi:MAG TPA: hypothetical protein PK718_02875 [Candidatus Methanofastidiosa archaeon]|nr:hypothetical protein [Candidatus Methanofastidiosa archaeon]HPR41474.1 hypothetical protein [Candidatus Methanofastidiosa archaeon]
MGPELASAAFSCGPSFIFAVLIDPLCPWRVSFTMGPGGSSLNSLDYTG